MIPSKQDATHLRASHEQMRTTTTFRVCTIFAFADRQLKQSSADHPNAVLIDDRRLLTNVDIVRSKPCRPFGLSFQSEALDGSFERNNDLREDKKRSQSLTRTNSWLARIVLWPSRSGPPRLLQPVNPIHGPLSLEPRPIWRQQRHVVDDNPASIRDRTRRLC